MFYLSIFHRNFDPTKGILKRKALRLQGWQPDGSFVLNNSIYLNGRGEPIPESEQTLVGMIINVTYINLMKVD